MDSKLEEEILNTYNDFLFEFAERILKDYYIIIQRQNCKYVRDFAVLNTKFNKYCDGQFVPTKFNERILEIVYNFINFKFHTINIDLINKYTFIFITKLYKEEIEQLLILYKLRQ